MDFKANAKYFEKSRLGVFIIVGLALAVIGILVGIFTDYKFMVWLGLLSGVLLAVIGFSIEPKDRDFDDAVRSNDRDFRNDFHEKFLEGPMDRTAFLTAEYQNRKDPEYWSCFIAESEDTLVRKGNDGSFRSTDYCMCGVWFEKERVSFGSRVLNVLNGEKQDDMHQLAFSAIESASLVNPKFEQAKAVKYTLLCIKEKNGTTYYLPARTDARTDDIVASINQGVKRMTAAQ